MVKYTVNDTTVRCIISTNHKTFIGIAKLNPVDTFDLETGKQIAYKRALLKIKKQDLAEYKTRMESTKYFYDLHLKDRKTQFRIKSQICSIITELDNLCNS